MPKLRAPQFSLPTLAGPALALVLAAGTLTVGATPASAGTSTRSVPLQAEAPLTTTTSVAVDTDEAEPIVSGLIVKMKATDHRSRDLRIRAAAGSITAAAAEQDLAGDAVRTLIDSAPELADAEVADDTSVGDGSTVLHLAESVSGAEAEALAAELADRADVEWAEPDYRLFATDVAPIIPHDPYFDRQWSLWDTAGTHGRYSVRAPQAWGVTTGDKSVVVAVLDTGITSHPELNGRVVAGYDMVSDPKTANDGNGRDSNPADPGDWINARTRPSDCPVPDMKSSWHGTHVAGIIAAEQNGVGVSGIAPAVRIQPVRVLGVCGGSVSDIAAGIRWAAGGTIAGVPKNATPAKVVNLSLGGPGACGKTFQSAVDFARSQGALVVIAAGNDSQPARNYSPANCKNVLTVTSTGRKGQRASYSNYGTAAAPAGIAAPGGDTFSRGSDSTNTPSTDYGIASTYNSGKTTPGTPTYGYLQGTSMAAPAVSGVAALVLSKANLTPADLTARLKRTAQPFPTISRGEGTTCTIASCGAGIIDAGAAVADLDTAPANDNFAAAAQVSGQAGSVTGRTTAATQEPGEPVFATNAGGASVWYRYVAPSTGKFTVSTAGSSFDTLLAVYRGETIDGLARLGANNNAPGVVTSEISAVPMTKGTTYYILVDGSRVGAGLPAVGSVKLSWRLQFFSDVAPGTPFFNEVEWLAVQKISLGNPDGTFSPAATISRQAMAAFFYRMNHHGDDAPACTGGKRKFTDVPATNQFCGAIEWLAENKITTGVTPKTFGPGQTVTREAMSAFLYRYHQLAKDLPIAALPCSGKAFVDVKKTHPLCGEIEWSAANGITSGNPAGKFLPADKVTRLSMAAFLYRLSITLAP
ncbi:hypothetical protein D1871_19530 [Nakamurella silvestris]|nr:hypothetical protein D1871_19530 [Nakamurella silvestris]